MFFRNLPPVIRGILVALAAAFVISVLLPSIAMSFLPLFSELVTRSFQLWRLVTYPFYFVAPMAGLLGNLFRLIWIGMLIVVFGAELEQIIHSRRLALALGSTIVLGGIVFSFLDPTGVLAGPHLISMFILAGFAYLWPDRQISILGFFTVKAWIVAVAIFLLTIIPFEGFNMDTSASNLFAPIFGALAALVYFHITYRQYSFGRDLLDRLTPSPTRRKKSSYDANDPRAIQQRIDMLLDKISRHGMDSLSKEEREFLLRNSGS